MNTVVERGISERTGASLGPKRPEVCQTVVDCYDFFDRVFPECGLLDLTEGMYFGDPTQSLEQAERNQLEWLLDEARCPPGTRLLDIGCGNGTLLDAARRRGVRATGITISPPQVVRCRQWGLDVHLLDYRAVPETWSGRFDAIVANGSIEHFVQVDDVLAGRADPIYHDLFALCHRLIDPASPSRRFVTTTIHCNPHTPVPPPEKLRAGPLGFAWFSGEFHYALLQRGFGGFFPALGQLERCAAPYFRLVGEVDGTEDYHWTSEECFRRVRRAMLSPWRGPRLWRRLLPYFLRHPRQCMALCFGLLVAESWQRQFRGPAPPTTLLRQTWEYLPSAAERRLAPRPARTRPRGRLPAPVLRGSPRARGGARAANRGFSVLPRPR